MPTDENELQARALEEAADDLFRDLTLHRDADRQVLRTIQEWLRQRAQDLRYPARVSSD